MSDTETSSRRAEANRRNAQKSCGPRTAAGKQRSRFNALKHGLRAETSVLPGEDPKALRDRLDAWTDSLAPRDEVERYLVERAVQLSWRLERADRAQAARDAAPDPDEPARLAAEADSVAQLGRRLFWDPRGPTCFYPQWEMPLGHPPRVSWSGQVDDPGDPQRVLIALEATPMGCAWLLDRWAELREILDDGLPWQPHDQFKAVRLLGRQPLEAVDDPRVILVYTACWALHEEGGSPLVGVATELDAAERKRFIDRINDREGMRWAPEDATAAEAELRGLIGEEEARLEGLLAGHLARAEATAAARRAFDESGPGERLRRYEQACDRSLVRILEALRKRRREAGGPKQAGRDSIGRKEDKSRDAARRIGQLLDFLAPGRDVPGPNGATRPRAGRSAEVPVVGVDGPRSEEPAATVEGVSAAQPAPPAPPAPAPAEDRGPDPRGVAPAEPASDPADREPGVDSKASVEIRPTAGADVPGVIAGLPDREPCGDAPRTATNEPTERTISEEIRAIQADEEPPGPSSAPAGLATTDIPPLSARSRTGPAIGRWCIPSIPTAGRPLSGSRSLARV